MQLVAEKPRNRDAILSVRDFLEKPIPERKTYLGPWLAEQSISYITGPRGVGKTWLALSLAYSITTGEPLGPWSAEDPAHVLFVDAESSQFDLQARLKKIVQRDPVKTFSIYSTSFAAEIGLPSPNLLSESWRAGVREFLISEGYNVIILDNLASLSPGIDENSKKDFDPINQFLLSLRFAGIASVVVHHTGKTGDQRGTSAREDNIDSSILLSAPPRRDENEGAKFTLTFSKCRGLYGPDIHPLVLSLGENEQGELAWTWSEVQLENKKKIIKLLDEGVSQRDVAEELGLTKGYVSRIRKEAVDEDLLTSKNQLTQSGFFHLSEG
jgi:putative DNA primase/helicase